MTEMERVHIMLERRAQQEKEREEKEREYCRTHPILCNCVECWKPLRERDLCCPDVSPYGIICSSCLGKRVKPVREVIS